MASLENSTGRIYWLTGLSGAGKTTIGRLWYEKLKTEGENVVFLDGDELRQVFGDDLGYTEADRRKSAMRNARLCALLGKQGFTVVCCTISMFDSVRAWNRENIPGYFEVYPKRPCAAGIKRGYTAPRGRMWQDSTLKSRSPRGRI